MDELPRKKSAKSAWKLFGNLKVRPKVMVLHNVFFLVLSGAIYFVLYPDLGQRASINLIIVLAVIYVLAVIVLEIAIMPQYVYRPLKLMLDADQAAHDGDRERELIDEPLILGDEIGQIMRSRNATIRELRCHEEAIQEALQRLEAQDRLVSLGLLAASVAHELNTPLTVLQGSVEKLAETIQEDAAQQRLQRMLRVTQRLRKISEGLVDFARVRTQHDEAVPMHPLIEEAWSLVGIDEKASDVHFANFVTPDQVATGNPDRLIQVFVNLLRNSLNAVHSGGTIEVASRRFQRNGHGWISVKVEDNGPGIPAEVLPDVFEAFVSTRLDARGTGLGLTVAEGIVHQHGGTISAANRVGGGACLEVTLPAPEPPKAS